MRIEEVIGQRIRDVREINDVTQQQLGQRLGELLGKEWSRQAVSSAEKGERAFTAVELVAIARALGTTVPRLMTPPLHARSIELPSGAEIGRTEVVDAALPRASAEENFDAADENLRSLAENLQVLMNAGQNSMRHVELIHKHLSLAASALAHRIREEIPEGAEVALRAQEERKADE